MKRTWMGWLLQAQHPQNNHMKNLKCKECIIFGYQHGLNSKRCSRYQTHNELLTWGGYWMSMLTSESLNPNLVQDDPYSLSLISTRKRYIKKENMISFEWIWITWITFNHRASYQGGQSKGGLAWWRQHTVSLQHPGPSSHVPGQQLLVLHSLHWSALDWEAESQSASPVLVSPVNATQ